MVKKGGRFGMPVPAGPLVLGPYGGAEQAAGDDVERLALELEAHGDHAGGSVALHHFGDGGAGVIDGGRDGLTPLGAFAVGVREARVEARRPRSPHDVDGPVADLLQQDELPHGEVRDKGGLIARRRNGVRSAARAALDACRRARTLGCSWSEGDDGAGHDGLVLLAETPYGGADGECHLVPRLAVAA